MKSPYREEGPERFHTVMPLLMLLLLPCSYIHAALLGARGVEGSCVLASFPARVRSKVLVAGFWLT